MVRCPVVQWSGVRWSGVRWSGGPVSCGPVARGENRTIVGNSGLGPGTSDLRPGTIVCSCPQFNAAFSGGYSGRFTWIVKLDDDSYPTGEGLTKTKSPLFSFTRGMPKTSKPNLADSEVRPLLYNIYLPLHTEEDSLPSSSSCS